ncbi:hypothetical protein BC793_104150 [Actinoplanes xinjiangensis]|jgi:hypothetical protein|uniref:Uncharacterized protein n=1 Tax=Actinoplanes xinjiangensis TaxID=512350 RepID=A0A316G4Y6_9ACTN|nr:hypothetical protein BC793_104150 [Actinoplanes xinjiangensis]GIF37482.1 hypothetical protein Axi01nite_17930 [Actinoplanes xinjiangensis]
MVDVTDGPDGTDRGATELILGALAGSALLPFLQAVATRAGEDAYQAIRDRLPWRSRRGARAELKEAGVVSLAARDARVVLQLPERVTPVMAARLENVRLPVDRTGWAVVSWDEVQSRWVVELVAEPPPSATPVEP